MIFTQGFIELVSDHTAVAKWAAQALRVCRTDGGYPDMIVGREAVKPRYEDEGRTLVLPLSDEYPKCYALPNEVGGVTMMLADEY